VGSKPAMEYRLTRIGQHRRMRRLGGVLGAGSVQNGRGGTYYMAAGSERKRGFGLIGLQNLTWERT